MSLGGGHLWLLLILLIIVLIIWGPGKLPDIGSGLGRAIREFRQASQETKDAIVTSARGDEPAAPPPSTPPPPSSAPPPPPPPAPPSEQR